MSQHINICWDFFLSILFEFPNCNNLSKLSNSFSIAKNTDMSVLILAFLKPEYLCWWQRIKCATHNRNKCATRSGMKCATRQDVVYFARCLLEVRMRFSKLPIRIRLRWSSAGRVKTVFWLGIFALKMTTMVASLRAYEIFFRLH